MILCLFIVSKEIVKLIFPNLDILNFFLLPKFSFHILFIKSFLVYQKKNFIGEFVPKYLHFLLKFGLQDCKLSKYNENYFQILDYLKKNKK